VGSLATPSVFSVSFFLSTYRANNTLDIVDKRREVKRLLSSTASLKPVYSQLTREIRQGINRDHENWCIDNCNQLEKLQNTHQTSSLHKKIKELTRGTKIPDKSITIKDRNGTVLTTEDDVRIRWSEYCSDLYNYDIDPDISTLADLWVGQEQEQEPDIIVAEVEAAITKLKPMKAPGIEGVCGELIQYGGEAAPNGIHAICQRAWKEESFPQIRTKSVIVAIPKKKIDAPM
jgi:hypothetical protein